ncbi:MAG: transporter substrate-binding domain-containing protein [Gammaproteobacteria bacterium]|nr:transporter substrate-binding domain-containing protein [Gammaproteobacteria bacterium]MBU1601850.1 transporter substrate-binding domain-containing protein [Gammaproteobacteria bacterium]MBU2432222.1 transporter substrate-binding domain-containing protein [Gammaproteobacteria bacterium]MBU2450385.1 transporter substrate-binding domain-containing protein [Gammaproteobacteria bacterium]
MQIDRTPLPSRVFASKKRVDRWPWLLAGLLFCSLGMISGARAADKIVLNVGVLAPYTTPDRQGFLDRIVVALFREVGLDAEVQVFPTATERSMLNANSGIDDGLAMRIEGLEKQYPNLIRVPEPLIVNDFVAYSNHQRFTTDSWDSLEPYVVSYIIGWKVFEKNVRKAREVTLVRDADQLFGLLGSGRADVVLYERWQGLERLRGLGIKAQVMEPPLVRANMFIYLNKKHAALVPQVSQALLKLKKNGSYQHIVDATLTPLTP